MRVHVCMYACSSVWSGGSVLQSPLALLNQVCQGILKMKSEITVVECVGKSMIPYHTLLLGRLVHSLYHTYVQLIPFYVVM